MDHTPHIRLLALVRWQIFINSMEIKSKRENLAAKIVIGLLGISFAGGGALLFGTVAYAGSKGLRLLEVLSVTLWAPFLLWQFVTMLTAAVMQLDYQKISRYPIPFWKFCTLELATGVIDPVAGTALFWLAGAWVGILLGNPSLIPRATLMMVEMAVVSLLISRAVAEYIERWVSTRKGRARFFGVMIALSMLSQFSIFTSSSSWGALHAMTSFKYYGYLPPGLAWNGVSGALLPSIVGLAAYALASGLLLFHRYRLKYQGELHSDGRGEVTVAGVQMGWQFPWLSAAQSAMLEKELRYIFGMPMGTLTFVIGPVTAFFTTFGFVRARHTPFPAELLFPALAGWMLMMLGSRSYNYFSLDSTGFSRYLLAPMPVREVIAMKNLTNALIMVLNFIGASLVFVCLVRTPLMLWTAVLAGYTAVSLVMMAAGNFFSVRYPIAVDLDKMRSKTTSSVATLGTIGVQVTVIAVMGSIFYWKLPVLPICTALALLAGWLFTISAANAARYTEAHGEEIAKLLIV